MPAYRSLVDDLTRGPRARAARAAQTVLGAARLDGLTGGAGERMAQLADEVGQASRANRELFEQLVAVEVGRAARRLGLVPQAELRDAREQLAALGDELAAQRVELDVLRAEVAGLRSQPVGQEGP